MGDIPWIQNAAAKHDDSSLKELVNQSEATRIACERDLGIKNAETRVDAFAQNLPALFSWFGSCHRDFPWRRTHDPWAVIVAEILLQRTRAEKVAEIYNRFMERFPGPEAVQTADTDDIFRSVETLGFGNRKTGSLTSLAEAVCNRHEGKIPEDLDVLLKLPRIGPYTARACLCFAYGHPLAVVDTNVARVMEDALGYSASGRAHKDRALYDFLDALIPEEADAARVFNLALLDLGGTVCNNKADNRYCPLEDACFATETHS